MQMSTQCLFYKNFDRIFLIFLSDNNEKNDCKKHELAQIFSA